MNPVYLAIVTALPAVSHAQTALDFSSGWTSVAGSVVYQTTPFSTTSKGTPFTLNAPTGSGMYKLSPAGSSLNNVSAVDTALGLTGGSIDGLLNHNPNSSGHTTNFSVLTQSMTLNAGTYSFAWAFNVTDPGFNDGALFAVSGGGTQIVESLARAGGLGDTTGPSPNTYVAYTFDPNSGVTPWLTTTFTIATTGIYQVSFADYNWNDMAVDPRFFLAGTIGTYTGNPLAGTNATPPPDITPGTVLGSDLASGSVNAVFDGGTVQADVDNAVYGANLAIKATGGTIDQNGLNSTFSGVLSDQASGTPGAISFVNGGSSTGAITLTGVNTYTGQTTIGSGAHVALAGAGSISTSTRLVNDGVFDISATTAGAALASLAGAGAVQLGGQVLTLTNAADTFGGAIGGSGGLAIAGGTQTLSGVNGYTGATSVASGATLTLSGAGSIAASSTLTNNGTFDIAATTAGATLQGLAGGGTVTLGAQSLTLANASGTYAGSIDGSGGLAVVGGTQTLSGVNAYTGQTSIGSGATLALAGNGAITTSSGVANAGTLDISAAAADATVSVLTGAGQVVLGARTLTVANATGFTGSLSGTGGLTVTGGSLVLAGTQAYTGLTTVGTGALVSANGLSAGGFAVNTGGTLHGSGAIAGPITVASGGILSPGNSPGVLTVNASVDLAPGAVFEAEVNGNTPGNGAGHHDQLRLVGNGSQFNANGATLEVNLTQISGLGGAAAYVPQWGDSYRIVTAEGGLGTTRFATLAQPDGLGDRMRLRVFYSGDGGGAIDVRVVPLSLAEYGTDRGLNRNAIAAASALDRMVAASDAGTETLAQRLLADTALGLDATRFDVVSVALAGEIHGAMAAAQSLAGQGLQASVTNHLTLGGGDRLWVDYGTGEGRWSADGVSSSARNSHNQFTLGLDVFRNETTRIGAAAARSTTQVDSSAGGSGKLEENLVVLYGQHAIGDWKIDAQLGGGRGSSTTHRADPLAALDPTLAATSPLATDLGTDQRFASIGVRMPSFVLGSASLEPFARIGTQQVKRDAGSETSTAAAPSPSALSLVALSASGTRVTAGVTIASTMADPMVAPYTLRGALALGHDGGSLLNPTVSAELAGMATTIQAPEVGRTFAQGRLSGTWLLARNAYVYGNLQGEARSQRTETAVNAGVAVAF